MQGRVHELLVVQSYTKPHVCMCPRMPGFWSPENPPVCLNVLAHPSLCEPHLPKPHHPCSATPSNQTFCYPSNLLLRVGPSTVAGMAAAKGWTSSLVPSILTSTLGYAIGSFIGIGLGHSTLIKIGP